MIKISSKSQYGIRALVFMAKKDRLVSIADISEHEKIPFEFLEKIVQKLKKARILISERGARGGYALAKNPEKISIKEILIALDDLKPPVRCVDQKKSPCKMEKGCSSKFLWRRLYAVVSKELGSISLAEIAEQDVSELQISSNESISCSR